MNTPEKIAATYLRLNGFLLLPHFTVFCGKYHNHVDLIGYRLPNSKEIVNGELLPCDDSFFNALTEVAGFDSKKSACAIVVEIRGNKDRDSISDEHIEYIRQFLGNTKPERITFCSSRQPFHQDQGGLCIDLKHSFNWIQQRIKWMEDQKFKLSKTGSWNLSDEFLSDMLLIHRMSNSH